MIHHACPLIRPPGTLCAYATDPEVGGDAPDRHIGPCALLPRPRLLRTHRDALRCLDRRRPAVDRGVPDRAARPCQQARVESAQRAVPGELWDRRTRARSQLNQAGAPQTSFRFQGSLPAVANRGPAAARLAEMDDVMGDSQLELLQRGDRRRQRAVQSAWFPPFRAERDLAINIALPHTHDHRVGGERRAETLRTADAK
jgi:hypothetical protein